MHPGASGPEGERPEPDSRRSPVGPRPDVHRQGSHHNRRSAAGSRRFAEIRPLDEMIFAATRPATDS